MLALERSELAPQAIQVRQAMAVSQCSVHCPKMSCAVNVLAQRLISEAREIGYASVRLDSTRFMKAPHALYRALGFREIEPYPESEIPLEFQSHWVFMEMALR